MSTKEEKKKIREEKKQAELQRQKRNSLFLKVALGIFIPVVLFVFYQGLFGGAPILAPDEVAASDHVRGPDDAPVTITVYADFQCPQCLTETEVIALAWPRIRDNARLVFRHYPLNTHRHAFLAARYAEAASRQDKFWDMHDLLFVNQAVWSGLDDAAPIFDGFAQQLELDMDQLLIDLESDDVRAKIVADQQGGTRAGVRGTPVIFFNGRRVNNARTAGEFVEMVNDAVSSL